MKFTATKEESAIIQKIAIRAHEMAKRQGKDYPIIDAIMDVEACHCNGMPLDLERFLAASAFDFSHDAFGIYRHINRETGAVEDCFVPRMARKLSPLEVA